ncbi:GNRHR [Lepeophtheirus salmonis]|uniref:GNRHR n=1 Tax=Lepeophtheirus salmonis TaxID=72036 RepID=A0A7R8CI15_LEPSM|nr:GNRHR [Lepeophtheirus salmonis]CAF2827749.1 GNRHR [Lepeophtheirus salmonis]
MEDLSTLNVTTSKLYHSNLLNQSLNASLTNFQEFVFNRRLLLNVIAYCIMFMIGTVSNISVFVAAYRRSRIGSSQFLRTNVHSMVLHLTVADLIVTIIVIPVEIFWRISVQWYIGNLCCKGFMFLRAFGFYLSSMTLVCLSLDRYIAISQPLATLEPRSNRRRGRIMLLCAWIISGFCALPQAIYTLYNHS